MLNEIPPADRCDTKQHSESTLTMSKIFITGSSDGLGLLSARTLADRGHKVYLHARNAQRAEDARKACPQATDCLIADLSSTTETESLASQLNEKGPFDAIVHNAGIMTGGGDGALFRINTLSPYLLTSLVDPPPKRYVFLSRLVDHWLLGHAVDI